MQTLAALCVLALLALLAGWLTQWLVLKVFRHMRETLKTEWAEVLMHDKVLRRLAKGIPLSEMAELYATGALAQVVQ